MNTNTQIGISIIIVILFTGVLYWVFGKDTSPSTDVSQVATASLSAQQEQVDKSEPTQVPQQEPDPANIGLPSSVQSGTITPSSIHMVTLDTNYGAITFELYTNDAPKTTENFTTLARKGFYNNLIFHRVIPGFMIQGGDPNGNGTGGPGYSFADELNPATASFKAGYKKGVVAMANAGPNTNGSQFFIMLADYPLPNNYTIFGKVTAGQDVVDKIGQVKTGANDKPVTPVVIKSVSLK